MQRAFNYARLQSNAGTIVATPTITVYNAGTLTLATIYSDNLPTPTPKTNPFLGDSTGFYYFYAANGYYDIRVSGGTPPISTPYTLGSVLLDDALGPNVYTTGVQPGFAKGGWVQYWPPLSTDPEVAGNAIGPDGRPISLVGTNTQGLQEAINYACNYGYDFVAHGGDEPGTGGSPGGHGGPMIVYLHTDATLEIPPNQGKRFRFGGLTLAGNGAGTNPLIRFDTFMMMDWDMAGGQLATVRTGDMVQFYPRSNAINDLVITQVDSRVRFQAIAKVPFVVGGAIVRFMPEFGNISDCTFIFDEINGGQSGIQVDRPTGAFGFAYNQISCPHVHSQVGTSPVVLIGHLAGAANARIQDNLWNLHLVFDGGTGGGDGFFTRATRDRGHIFILGCPNTQIDVRFEDQATQADLVIATDTNPADHATICREASTARDNRVSGQLIKVNLLPSLAASPATYPQNTDYQLLAWDHQFTITGGTVSVIELSHDQGATWYPTGLTSGVFLHRPGMRHRITYSSAPTLRAFV